jgi:hypothetical protein
VIVPSIVPGACWLVRVRAGSLALAPRPTPHPLHHCSRRDVNPGISVPDFNLAGDDSAFESRRASHAGLLVHVVLEPIRGSDDDISAPADLAAFNDTGGNTHSRARGTRAYPGASNTPFTRQATLPGGRNNLLLQNEGARGNVGRTGSTGPDAIHVSPGPQGARVNPNRAARTRGKLPPRNDQDHAAQEVVHRH